MREGGIFKHIRFAVIISLLCPLFLVGTALSYPCSDEPVNGDSNSEVAAKCGEAMLKQQQSVKVEETDAEGVVNSSTKNISEWLYGSGPDNLVQLFRFENGHLVQIKNLGYGTVNDVSTDLCRNGQNLAVGDTFAETFVKCGQPLAKEERGSRTVDTEIPGKTTRRTYVSIVEWTYRYGPDAPGYTVTFEDGVAVDVRTREFGK
jgi:hypothetical protein